MTILKQILKYLDDNGVLYLHTIHEPAYTARDVAAVEHLPLRDVAKVVVFHSERGYGMAVLPADRLLDLRQLRSTLVFDHLRLATEEELAVLFPDGELGAMPPFGNLYGLRVYVDQDLADDYLIAFNAGTHRDVVEMHYKDFDRLVKPRVVHLARPAFACG